MIDSTPLRSTSPDDATVRAFVQAVHNANVEAVRAGLAAGLDPNTTDASGWSVLMHACNAPDAAVERHTEVVQALLIAGADVHREVPVPPFPPMSALQAAVDRRQYAAVALLVEHGASPQPFLTDPLLTVFVRTARMRELLQTLMVAHEHRVLQTTLDLDGPAPERSTRARL